MPSQACESQITTPILTLYLCCKCALLCSLCPTPAEAAPPPRWPSPFLITHLTLVHLLRLHLLPGASSAHHRPWSVTPYSMALTHISARDTRTVLGPFRHSPVMMTESLTVQTISHKVKSKILAVLTPKET